MSSSAIQLLYGCERSKSRLLNRVLVPAIHAVPVASPEFGARKGTCKSYWVFTGCNCRCIVAVRLCTGQSALKKLIVVSQGGHVPQCPIAGEANVQFRLQTVSRRRTRQAETRDVKV